MCCTFNQPVICPIVAGNNPWPIGVTSIGIHERSSREKISHVMNGSAHIMNDEATRKYLQAVKRLLTFLQRAYPTDPSRSVDFDGFRDAGLGAKGAGSDKAVSTPARRASYDACQNTCRTTNVLTCILAVFAFNIHMQKGISPAVACHFSHLQCS